MDHGHTHGNVGRAHVSAACERGESLDVDVEELAKGNGLGIAQLREVSRNVLDRAVALAQLDGERSATDVTDGSCVTVLGEIGRASCRERV